MQRIATKLKRIGHRLLVWFVWASVIVFFLWSIGALYFLTSVPYFLRIVLAIAYVSGAIWLFRQVKDRSQWLAMIAGSVIVVYLITLSQRPANDRLWVKEQKKIPAVSIDHGNVKITNVRHNLYQTETKFKVQHRDLQFRLDQLERVWFIVHKFSALEGLAHTFVSFEITRPDGPDFFSVSVEVRREQDEVYSPIRGLYRQFELMYVVADERDVIGSRTVMRPNDRLHMYRVNATPEQVQELFVEIASRIEKLRDEPEYYHTLLNNCTNGIVSHTYELTPEPINWLDPRIVLSGFSARFAYAKGLIGDEGKSYADLQQRCRVDEAARELGLIEEFSVKIRE